MLEKKRDTMLMDMKRENISVGKGLIECVESIYDKVESFEQEGGYILQFLEICRLFERYRLLTRDSSRYGMRLFRVPEQQEELGRMISRCMTALATPLIWEEETGVWDRVRICATHCDDCLEVEGKETDSASDDLDNDRGYTLIFRGKEKTFNFIVRHPGCPYEFRARVRKGEFVSEWSSTLKVQTQKVLWEPCADASMEARGNVARYTGRGYATVTAPTATYVKEETGLVKWTVTIKSTSRSFIFIGADNGKRKRMFCCKNGKVYPDPQKPTAEKYANDIRGLGVGAQVAVVFDYANNLLSFEVNGNRYAHSIYLYEEDADEEEIRNTRLAVTLSSSEDSVELSDIEIEPPQQQPPQ